MEIEKLIKDTFVAHEHVAPDGDTVLAAARKRIDRGRPVLTRPIAVAAGVVALSIAAATVVALNRSDPAPADTPPAPAVEFRPAIEDLKMPFSLGWLPPGPVDYLTRRVRGGGTVEDIDRPKFGGEYMLTVRTGGRTLNVNVSQVYFPVEEATFNSGPGRPVTIDGQRGVESANSGGPGGYAINITRPGGGTVAVHVSDENRTMPEQQLVETGRRIARHIDFPGTTTVTPSFGFRDLPDRLRICEFAVGKSFEPAPAPALRTSYALGTCVGMPPVRSTTAPADEPRGNPGKPVQGHETRHLDENGLRSLWVLDAVDGDPVVITGKVPLADLYDLANRLVLPD